MDRLESEDNAVAAMHPGYRFDHWKRYAQMAVLITDVRLYRRAQSHVLWLPFSKEPRYYADVQSALVRLLSAGYTSAIVAGSVHDRRDLRTVIHFTKLQEVI